VEIVFTSNTPELVRIRRTLSLNGNTSIFVNDCRFSEEDFGHFLLQSKIHVASRNFMLLQGEADFLATASPATMTELFERMSGSIQFKKDCVLLEKRLLGVKQTVMDLSHQKAQVRTEQKKLKELLQTSA
jgi:structural maintenance of chromosome 1